ncbi:leucyl-tRNA synthetase [Halohasta litchfieldiae]|jgi:leucyl-tRNA synthetase|uniref:Leucine--tRNA ligase n=1 Tax=Halohasta litchfieldiae TaxID=1073996 RepID=A0A1H6R5Z6_9EURY|nr:leucine--tRNA ligase [Halohasta litchfieldiae]ATW88677.1 leucyl-tRNA synthetase [Halohasta litchfieldiae]SEI47045.1 leucyl-tRNA synthetase [Halohasta litchfieldiae]
MDYNPQELEADWRERWDTEERYEPDPTSTADPEAEETTFITVPYPYPSGGMHIGHARTYTVPDVYARYRRQQGDNVLFPMAWHVTGTPIIGAVERLEKREEKQMSVLQDTYNVSDDVLSDLETPMGYARHFIEEHYKTGMQSLGLSIDWRREFTTNDDRYSKFITWQYETLRERGRLEKGLHPVKFCTEQENPVTTHDLLEGENVEYQEYTLVKFEQGDMVVPMATLRPETVRGVTNAYINPNSTYVEATVDGEQWLVSVEAAEKLELQDHEVDITREFQGSEFVGEHVTNPVTGDEVLVLPAEFVDADNATGVVMSVPAHSPDDYLALLEAKADPERLESYGIDPTEVDAIEPVPILDVEGYGDIPAKDAVESAGITSSNNPNLKEVTQDVYNAEFHTGRLHDEYGEFSGELIEDVRDELAAAYREQGSFGELYDFPEPVISRAGGKVVVAYQDTWFLSYNDEDWKAEAKRVVDQLDTIPDNTRGEYDHTIDWLNEWPCIRNYGLGTRLPWDESFVIEPLSDSTIYMAYYTIAHRLDEIPTEDLDREFFDALFYGDKAVDGKADPRALDLRAEWQYWYPVTQRFSANDLISNHLTFYLFHHAELFDEAQWPEGITIMGMGLLEGEKMSSSKGHVVLPGKAIEDYGADTVRFFLLNSAEPWQDYDWRSEQVAGVERQLTRFWNRAQELISEDVTDDVDPDTDLEHIDRWLLSKLQTTVADVTAALDNSETRTASQAAFYGFDEHLKWYRRRADLDRPGAQWTLQHVLETRLRLLAPFIPFMTNELHEQLTGTPAEDAPWPEVESEWQSTRTETEERGIERLTGDIQDILKVTEQDPETIRVYVAADWKQSVFETVRETGTNVGDVMGEVMQDPDLRERGNEVNQLVQDLVELVRSLDDDVLAVMDEIDERSTYETAVDFLEREYDAAVEIYAEDGVEIDDPEDRASKAVPFRPAIHIE